MEEIDEEMDGRCYVCGVDDEPEELSGEEGDDEVEVRGGAGGEEVVRAKAVRDKREVKRFGDPRRPSEKEVK